MKLGKPIHHSVSNSVKILVWNAVSISVWDSVYISVNWSSLIVRGLVTTSVGRSVKNRIHNGIR